MKWFIDFGESLAAGVGGNKETVAGTIRTPLLVSTKKKAL